MSTDVKPKEKIGWAYIRVSNSASQGQILHGSLEQQENRIRRWETEKSIQTGIPHKITRYISEDISGQAKYLSRRKEYHEMVRAIETRKIEFVVVEKLDRMHRDQIELLKFIKLCEINNVSFERLDGGVVDWRDRGSRLAANVEIMMAHEYVIDLMEKKSKKNREARVNNGKDNSTMPILGLDPHPTDVCFYLINEEEQKQVKDIFEHFCSCGDLTKTAKHCQKMGYLTKVRWTKETVKKGKIVAPRKVGGEAIDSRRVETIITSGKLAGYGHFYDDWNQFPKLQDKNKMVRYEYRHGPVVDTELFLRAKKLIEKNKELNQRYANQRAYPLHGIFYAADGSKFVGSAGTGRGKILHHYYINRAHNITIKAPEIETIVINYIKGLCNEDKEWSRLMESTVVSSNHRLEMLRKTIKEKSTQLKQLELEATVIGMTWKKLAAQGLAEEASEALLTQLTSKVDLEKKITPLKVEIEFLENEKKQIENIDCKTEVLGNLKALWSKMQVSDSTVGKRIIQSVVKRLEYSPGDKQLTFHLNSNLCDKTNLVRMSEEWRDGRDLNPWPPA